MTDARFPERWLNDRRVLRLSDVDFRTFVTTLVWSVANRTDGRLEPDDLALLPGARDAAPRLTQAGLWETTNGTVTIIDYDDTQTSSEQFDAIDERRRRDRERKRARRSRGATSTGMSEPMSTPMSTRTSVRNPLGQGQGQAKAPGQEEVQVTDDETNVWTEARPPGSGPRSPVPGAFPAGTTSAVRCIDCGKLARSPLGGRCRVCHFATGRPA